MILSIFVKNYIDMKSVFVAVLTFLMIGCGYAQVKQA